MPQAPKFTSSGPNQELYRIDASRSSVGYHVDETLAGTTHTATGTTKGVAGDILIHDMGGTIRVECSWDRSAMTTPEPRYIIWSEGTEDEMCDSVVATIKLS